MQKTVLCLCLIIPVVSVITTATAHGETLILDETAWFRSYFRWHRDVIDADVLREEGEELLGTNALRRMRAEVMRRLRNPDTGLCGRSGKILRQRPQERGIDPETVDWTEHVQARFGSEIGMAILRRHGHGFRPPAPADWHTSDFDDSAWVRTRTPLQMGWLGMNGLRIDMPAKGIRDAEQHVHTSYFRANFYVEDVRRDAPLTLSMQFRGGVRVFVNGHEIARSHLPEGELHPDTRAQAYPLEAYIVKPEELSEEERNDLPNPKEDPRGYFSALFKALDLSISYDQAAEKAEDGDPGLPREVWERIYNARERHLENVTIPAEILRQGRNVLAIELRTTPIHPVTQQDWFEWFAHSRIKWLRLTSPSEHAVSSLKRPQGMQVWVPDMHERIHCPHFLEPGAPAGKIKISAARNGTFGAQIAIGSGVELEGFRVEVSDLASENGQARIENSQFRILGANSRRGDTTTMLGVNRGRGGAGGRGHARDPILQRRYDRGPQEVNHLDELTDELFSTIPADHAMAVWLSLRVPDDAQPGVYTGKATVSADGVEPVDVPIEVKVSDWRIPDPADFTVFSGVTVNPHALHRRYSHKWVEGRRPTSLGWHDYIRQSDTKAEGWYSAPHLALIRRTYQLLARIGGGDWLDIYVLNNQHEIVWIRQPGGSLQFDFANLERLLDVVVETSGKPKVINFNIMYPGRSDDYVAPVPVREHDGNEIEWVDLGSDADPEIRKEYWRQFAEALYAFMRSKGLEDRMYWGTPWDLEGDHELVELMRSVLPQVYWTRKSHGFMPNETYRAVSVVYRSGWARDNPTIVGFHDGFPVPALESMLGWNNEEHYLLANTREHSSIHFLPGKYPPLGYRVMPERCLVRGYIGYGVVTAEDRGDALPIRGPRHVGIGIRMLYWPGPDGMNTGVHVEALLEGIQEAEARIFIERAIVAGRLPDELKERAIELLNERTAAVDHIRVNAFGRFGQMFELHHGWRERSEALYELAAEVAQFVD